MLKKCLFFTLLLSSLVYVPLAAEITNCTSRCLTLKNLSKDRVTVRIDTQPDTDAPPSIDAIQLAMKTYYLPVGESRVVQIPERTNIFMIYWQFSQTGNTYKTTIQQQPSYENDFFIIEQEKDFKTKSPYRASFGEFAKGFGYVHNGPIQSESNTKILGS